MNPPYALACNECGTVETGLGFEAAIGYDMDLLNRHTTLES
mgnify:CR=1 FL=1